MVCAYGQNYLEPGWLLCVLQQSGPKLYVGLVETELHITLQHTISAALEGKEGYSLYNP